MLARSSETEKREERGTSRASLFHFARSHAVACSLYTQSVQSGKHEQPFLAMVHAKDAAMISHVVCMLKPRRNTAKGFQVNICRKLPIG